VDGSARLAKSALLFFNFKEGLKPSFNQFLERTPEIITTIPI